MNGVIVGCDVNQEWLLSWWWERYTRHNDFPVAFFDFGMSEKAKAWCEKVGRYLELPKKPNFLKEPALKVRSQFGDRKRSEIKALRSTWFQKPFAYLHTPFPLSCWIDLDCEIKGDIKPLFTALEGGIEIALVKEPEYVQKKLLEMDLIHKDETSYNSGVVAFRKGAKIIDCWVDVARSQNGELHGDQDALSRAIYLHRPALKELSPIYNWKLNQGPNPSSLIDHYVSTMKLQILLGTQFSHSSRCTS
jgi:hypothetical protein